MASAEAAGRRPCCRVVVGAGEVIDRNVSPAPHPASRNV